MAQVQYYGTGRRKSSVARVRLVPGNGQIKVNGKDLDEYFCKKTLVMIAKQPLVLTETEGRFDVIVNAQGGGSTGQAGTSTTTEIPPYAPLMFTIEVIPLNGDGTAQHPYNITAVKGLPQEESNVWITGYIVGVVDGTSVEENAQYAQTVSVKTNILLSDKRTAKKASEVIAVELPEGPIRDALNLADNKLNYRVKIALKGNIRPYLGQRGMTGVTQYVK